MSDNDIIELLSLTQTEIDALSDQSGLYKNSTTGLLNFDGTDMSGTGDMSASTYDPEGVEADAFNYGNFSGTWQISGPSTTVTLNSDIDNLDVDGFNIVYLTSGSQDRRITGIKAPAAGVNRVICFLSITTQYRIKFVHQSTSSTVNNRIVLRGQAGTRNLLQLQQAFAIYNHNLNKWHITRIG